METQKFETLYGKDSKGNVKMWEVWVEDHGTHAVLMKKHGQQGKKMTVSPKPIYEGKNIGKSNETTPFDQAVSEAQSAWKKKCDVGMSPDIGNIDNRILLPMKAEKVFEHMNKITGVYYSQPKLNGVRCLAHNIDGKTIEYISKKNKRFTTVDHLTPFVLALIPEPGQVLDGELYIHGMLLQKIGKLTKKWRPDCLKLEYRVFDTVREDLEWEERLPVLQKIFDGCDEDGPVKLVSTRRHDDIQQLWTVHKEYRAAGFEGTMVRLPELPYKVNHRTYMMLKLKDWMDSEFKIVGYYQGTGVEEGCIMFRCALDSGKTFGVRPEGSRKNRREWFLDGESFIGKDLTVRFYEYTDDGAPFHGVGVVRDYE